MKTEAITRIGNMKLGVCIKGVNKMNKVKIEPTVTEDKKIFVSGEFTVYYDYPEDVFVIKPHGEESKIIRNLRETFYPRRNIMPQYELSYEKINQIIFNIEGENAAPIIKRLMKEDNGEERVIDGISTHLIEFISSPYAIVKNDNEFKYYKDYSFKTSKIKKSSFFKDDNLKETSANIIIEKFYTKEELDDFREENFKDLYCYSENEKKNKLNI